VIFLCFAAIVFDGYDLVIYGAITPALLKYEPWGLTPVAAGAIGSYALAGMFFGAILVGYLTDVLGRRKVLMGSIAFFSLLMLLTAAAPSAELFGVLRFLSGLGLGGVIPTAIALTVEYSAPAKRNFNNAVMFSGYSVGGVLASLLSLALLPAIGFRGMLALGGLPLVLILPFLAKSLPESPAFLLGRGRTAQARELAEAYGIELPAGSPAPEQPSAAENRFRTLFTGRLLAATVLFCIAGIAGQILVYGLNTWLPQLMILAKYSLASSLTFLLTVNVGAVVGVILSSRLADRFGPQRVTAVSFTSSGIALILMGTGTMPIVTMYVLVAVVGFGSVGAQILVNGFVATYFPNRVRATALGVTLGVGRVGAVLAIYGGGVLVAAALGTFVNFSVWAIAAALGVTAVLLVPSRNAASVPAGAASGDIGEPEASGLMH
jgi:AAHS family benzoate transporter-like MFS transporter